MILQTKKSSFTLVKNVVSIFLIVLLINMVVLFLGGCESKIQITPDISFTNELNTALNNNRVDNRKNNTLYEALTNIKSEGIDLEKIENLTDKNNKILWNQDTDEFVLINNEKLILNSPKKNYANGVNYWMISDTIKPEGIYKGYSIYLNNYIGNGIITDLTTGIDVGDNDKITSISYIGDNTKTASQEVIIRTNNTDSILNINSENDIVKHYGTVKKINVMAVSSEGYQENGEAYSLTLTKGKVVFEDTARITRTIVSQNCNNAENIKIVAKNSNNVQELVSYNDNIKANDFKYIVTGIDENKIIEKRESEEDYDLVGEINYFLKNESPTSIQNVKELLKDKIDAEYIKIKDDSLKLFWNSTSNQIEIVKFDNGEPTNNYVENTSIDCKLQGMDNLIAKNGSDDEYYYIGGSDNTNNLMEAFYQFGNNWQDENIDYSIYNNIQTKLNNNINALTEIKCLNNLINGESIISFCAPRGKSYNNYSPFNFIRIDSGEIKVNSKDFDSDNLHRIIVPSGVVEIKDINYKFGAYDEVVSPFSTGDFKIKSVIIPDTVTSINDSKTVEGAFSGNYSLENIRFSKNLTYIGENAFISCSSLNNIVLPNTLTTIGSYAFSLCNSLKNLIIPSSVTTIGAYAFKNCKALESVSIPKSLKDVGEGLFWYCSSLTNVVLEDGIKEIADGMFSDCTSLTELVIPSSVTLIGSWTFSCCSSLKSIIIPMNVLTIYSETFDDGCDSLLTIYCVVDSKPDDWEDDWNTSSANVVWNYNNNSK